MIMDRDFRQFMIGGHGVEEADFLDQNLVNTSGFDVEGEEEESFIYRNLAKELEVGSFFDQNALNLPAAAVAADPSPVSAPSSSFSSIELGDSSEDGEGFSDIVFNYISQMLMEEDMEEKSCMYSDALQAAEKPFYDILNECSPPLPDCPPHYHDLESPDGGSGSTEDNVSGGHSDYNSGGSNHGFDSGWAGGDFVDYPSVQGDIVYQGGTVDYNSLWLPRSSNNRFENASEGFDDSPVNKLRLPEVLSESEHVLQFKRGLEEASKFLPSGNLMFDLEKGGFPQKLNQKSVGMNVKVENKEVREHQVPRTAPVDDQQGSRGHKNPHWEDDTYLEQGRSNKQSAVYSEVKLESEEFDKVLLCDKSGSNFQLTSLQEALQNGVREKAQQDGLSKGSNGVRSRGKKQGKKEVVDLRALLIQCAQAVATDDHRTANEVLKQIRQHSSAVGDGSQRLAHYFAESLEARLAGTGSQIYSSLARKRVSAADILKSYHLFLAACPFRKISQFYANRSIARIAENATRIHIIDFGILYGFQWPCLIQRLSCRNGGSPHLRITGIDFPQPGFRPAEKIEETGNRLRDYARRFNVPFEYNAIATRWETIKVEDLKLDSSELLVVNCLSRFQNLVDETVVVDSPRNTVLNVVRKMNPQLFIHGVANGTYSAPFFITRFREALFHFSAFFDMLETTVPREQPERILLERTLFGREILNVIACEGSERIERPETYKQWQARMQRAGFVQLPVNQEIMKQATDKVRSTYHKDFIIDEDGPWMIQGWKGRILIALSTWRPDRVSH